VRAKAPSGAFFIVLGQAQDEVGGEWGPRIKFGDDEGEGGG
jgi:hypothetical protein